MKRICSRTPAAARCRSSERYIAPFCCGCDLRRVGLVLDRRPEQIGEAAAPSEVGEYLREAAHALVGPGNATRLPGHVDRRACPLSELGREHERLQLVPGCRLLPVVVEDAHELRLEPHHLLLDSANLRQRHTRDRRVDVLVELGPKPVVLGTTTAPATPRAPAPRSRRSPAGQRNSPRAPHLVTTILSHAMETRPCHARPRQGTDTAGVLSLPSPRKTSGRLRGYFSRCSCATATSLSRRPTSRRTSAASTSRPSRSGRDERARRSRRRERAGRADLPQGARARGCLPRRLKGEGKSVAEIELEPDLDWERAARETVRGDARRRRRRLPGRPRGDGWRGVADFLCGRDALRRSVRGATRRSTPSSPGTRSPPTSSSSASTASRSRGSRASSRSTSTSCSASGAGVVQAAGVRRLLPARPRAARGVRRRPAADRAVPDRPVPHLRLQAALRRALGRGRPPSPRRRDRRSQIEKLAAAGSRRSRRSAARRPSRGRHGIAAETFERLRSRPSCSSTRARPATTARSCCRRSPSPASRCCPTRRPATSSSTSRATRSGTTRAASSTSGASSTPTARFEPICATTARGGAGGVREVRRPRPRAARRAPGHARLPLRRSTRSPRSGG